ncbi:MAG: OsmC-like protein [Methanomassiliicoccales archaeon PtaU1.Bin124]|nr:MAG: OsmC-like protein [Methanomassiliicoccales archaeon PtaU1.Bin124]
MAIEEGDFKTRIELEEGYRFIIHFDDERTSDFYMDEPAPLGTGEYPNAGKFLAAAVGNCLCASLTYCVRRHHAEMNSLWAEVYTTLGRNEKGRLRITNIIVKLHPEVSDELKLDRCRDLFEDFCIVTESVKNGVPIQVQIEQTKKEG